MTNELIAQARKKYLTENPPRMTELPGFTADGQPAGSMTFPNLGDIQIIGCKLGMEYLAICHDEEAVEEWISASIGVVKEPDLAGILFANVFRGFNVIVAQLIGDMGLRDEMQKLALEAWNKNFNEGFDS